MIKIEHLNKFYNKNNINQIHVINDTSLELPNTGLVVFLGKSGSGKTTLLNVIGGLDKAQGKIKYDDLELNRYSSYKIDNYRNLNIGYVFQNYNILENETVYDNLKIALDIYKKLDEKEIDKRINYCLTKVGLFKYRKKLASELSGGEQQRVSIARALVKNAKIILADEPTGNLDSKNSIEVMNILSKISKDRLVLLVTHNEELARFYSDRIIRISDGKVIEDNQNISSSNLNVKDNSNIYLQDLDSKEINNDNLNINLYSANIDDINLNLDIVKIDSKIYLRCNQKIELIDSTSAIKLIDAKYEAIKKADLSDYDFDANQFEDKRRKTYNLKNLFIYIKNIFSSNFGVKRKTKLGYKFFFVIGVICAFAFSLLSIANYYDMSNYNITEGYVISGVNKDNFGDFDNKFYKLIDEDLITDLMYDYKDSVDSISVTSNNKLIPTLSLNSLKLGINHSSNYSVKYGSSANDNEICISYKLYEYMTEYYTNVISTDVNDIIGLTIKFEYNEYNAYTYDKYENIALLSKEFKIVGITNCTSAYEIYMTNNDYFNYVNLSISSYNFKPITSDIEIVEGRNIENEKEVILPYYLKYTYSYGQILDNYIMTGYEYTVVGFHKSNNLYYYISQDDYDSMTNSYYSSLNKISYSGIYNPNIEVTDGTYPSDYDEILVSTNVLNALGKNINDSIKIYDETYIISGTFNAPDFSSTSYFYISKKAYLKDIASYIINYYESYKKSQYYNVFSMIIDDNNIDKVNEILGSEFTLEDSYQFFEAKISSMNSSLDTLLPLIVVCLIVVCIYSFFMIRSKMMLEIKNIGILRAIGMKKYKFYLRYIVETIVLTTITSIFGYLVYVICFNYVVGEIPVLKSIFYLSPLYISLGIIFLYITSIIFGVLPSILLLRKTPQEILSKYDI